MNKITEILIRARERDEAMAEVLRAAGNSEGARKGWESRHTLHYSRTDSLLEDSKRVGGLIPEGSKSLAAHQASLAAFSSWSKADHAKAASLHKEAAESMEGQEKFKKRLAEHRSSIKFHTEQGA